MTAPPPPAWAPLTTHKRIDDLSVLAGVDVLAALSSQESAALVDLLEVADLAPGDVVGGPGDGAGLLLVLAGRLLVADDGSELDAGQWVGAEHLVEAAPRPVARFGAEGATRLARLTRARFEAFARHHGLAALALLRALTLASPRDVARPVARPEAPLGSTQARPLVRDRVPTELDGSLVVAARLRGSTLALTDAAPGLLPLDAVTLHDWEGREIYRRSAALACLEAAARAGVEGLSMGPSWTSGRLVLGMDRDADKNALAGAINHALAALVVEAVPLEEVFLPREEAIAALESAGKLDAARLLASGSSRRVALVRLGSTLALSPGAMLPHTGFLRNVLVLPHAEELSLDFGDRVRSELAKRSVSTQVLEQRMPRYGAQMTAMKRGWLEQLGVTDVGAFNQSCVSGAVNHLVDVAEGFHEKRIAELADRIRDRPGVRIVAVAGPSSSGKTTFLKRLRIQLEVAGVRPFGLSLDDYYVDRERNVRDAAGEYDFEALEAIDLALLGGHLERVLAGESVRTAHYDFTTGRSHPEGGPELSLPASGAVLVMEGIHALNPRLFGGAVPDASIFRVFIHPATALPFDALSTLEPADVRLLRRIVRDRHGRSTSAEQNLARWPSVRRGERVHIDPQRPLADEVFDTSLVYEVSVLKVFAERYLLEVPPSSPQFPGAMRLRRLIAPFVPIYPERVPPTSILREFIGGSGFKY